MHMSRPYAPLAAVRLADAVFWGCSSRPKHDVLPESIHRSGVPAQYWRLFYHRSKAAGMSCCQMWATFAQPADQFAACSPERADCLCKLKNQISEEHRRSAGKPLELVSIEFKRRCQDGAPPPLWLKKGMVKSTAKRIRQRMSST